MTEHIFEIEFHRKVVTRESVLQFIKECCFVCEHQGSRPANITSAYGKWAGWPNISDSGLIAKQIKQHLESMGFKQRQQRDGKHWHRLLLKSEFHATPKEDILR